MGLKEEVLRGIYGYGFTKPSPIQQKGILPVIQGHDTIAQVSIILPVKAIFYLGSESRRVCVDIPETNKLIINQWCHFLIFDQNLTRLSEGALKLLI